MAGFRTIAAAAAVAMFWLDPAAASVRRAANNVTCSAVPANRTFDYIIIGSGAGGIPMADRLSEAGHSVLLIEKGPVSSGRWGGTMKPNWLNGTNLTRFDVPGLCNQIWHDSIGVACTDVDQMAGCVLGGGTAVNSGLWWKPNPRDWDTNFPDGWTFAEMANATERVFSRIPGTTHPSMDGKLYMQQGFEMLGGGLKAAGWKEIVPNDHPDEKNFTFGHSTFMYSGGERGGPLATYLVSASQRKDKFALWTNTMAKRIVRTGGHATGVEVECASSGNGVAGTVQLTPNTGRVIVSAGAFGSAKVLLRSGIGTGDQLNIVKESTDGPTMISNDQWIDLPVGYNLNDHVGTDIEIAHPDVVFYDYYGAWNDPVLSDEKTYLANRTGMLAQAAPNLGPMFWQSIRGTDGGIRHLQWQARVEGSTNTSMTITQYLGTGSVSRGRMTITRRLDTRVSTPPYLHDDFDKEAVVEGIQYIVKTLAQVSNLTWIRPSPNVTVVDYVNSIPAKPAQRCSNHWIGTAKMGLDDGRAGGTAVVDTNTKVYGTDNIFVVDASIFPGHITGNPSAAIVIAAEHASRKILALPPPAAAKAGRSL
ncbi:cellobiose dehydrogenase [Niveomyces insectorum RCEF 264]|uniref:Cellobiose dehydrogenase n=1 Tax=Niveomyces insectorum RCEF 264 TaxID=1081102 RepID=A0A167ST31_9HYPO|nr:cellobiose dehydrogenase [Niveomyces insectorum RCEF 264]